jgi:hypothetical protein
VFSEGGCGLMCSLSGWSRSMVSVGGCTHCVVSVGGLGRWSRRFAAHIVLSR